MAAPQDSVSLSKIRRRLLSASADAVAEAQESVDFESVGDNPLLDPELQGLVRNQPAPSPVGYDEVEALLQRYQAEKSGNTLPDFDLRSPPPSVPPLTGGRRSQLDMGSNGSAHGDYRMGAHGSRTGLPPLTSQAFAEQEKIRAENAELKAAIAEMRQFLEQHDPAAWEERLQEAITVVTERDEVIESQKAVIEEWETKLKTQRFVPRDDDLAKMADELEKERCQLTQDRKQLESDREQLQDDEATLMQQMREMEVGMAKDRAELARQRTELQRLQGEIKHELDLLQRGDASMKERLATFQRRTQDAGGRGGQQSPIAPLPAPQATQLSAAPPRPKDSGVFKKLFGQGN